MAVLMSRSMILAKCGHLCLSANYSLHRIAWSRQNSSISGVLGVAVWRLIPAPAYRTKNNHSGNGSTCDLDDCQQLLAVYDKYRILIPPTLTNSTFQCNRSVIAGLLSLTRGRISCFPFLVIHQKMMTKLARMARARLRKMF